MSLMIDVLLYIGLALVVISMFTVIIMISVTIGQYIIFKFNSGPCNQCGGRILTDSTFCKYCGKMFYNSAYDEKWPKN